MKWDYAKNYEFICSWPIEKKMILPKQGDKTWFIAAIVAMKQSRAAVFVGAMAALAILSVISGKTIKLFALYYKMFVQSHQLFF